MQCMDNQLLHTTHKQDVDFAYLAKITSGADLTEICQRVRRGKIHACCSQNLIIYARSPPRLVKLPLGRLLRRRYDVRENIGIILKWYVKQRMCF